jgi:hypothetical protein
MTSKILATALASSISTVAFAQVLSSVDRLPVSGTGNCPTEVVLGSRGESFAQGIRFTVSTKDLIAEGYKLEIQGPGPIQDGGANTFLFTAPLRTPFKNCVGLTQPVTIFNELSTMQVVFEEGSIWVQVQVGLSLSLNLLSNFNNQAIFDLAERL